jgi:hypothetical protein
MATDSAAKVKENLDRPVGGLTCGRPAARIGESALSWVSARLSRLQVGGPVMRSADEIAHDQEDAADYRAQFQNVPETETRLLSVVYRAYGAADESAFMRIGFKNGFVHG